MMDVTNEELQIVSTLARKQRDLEDRVTVAEVQLAELKKQLDYVKSFELPNALAECGVSAFTLATGQKIEVKPHYYASIKEENKNEAFAWLRQHELDAVIKNTVKLEFGKGEDKEAAETVERLRGMGLPVQQAQTVHPMTLKSLIKDLMERGVDFPMEVFGAGVKNEAKITEPK